MTIDKNLIDQFIKVTTKAALSSSYLVGKEDKIAADKAAVDSMRSELNKMNIEGEIVIGEGELDEAPMLYIGEKVGNRNGPELDIAVDPLEGTNFAANNLPGALSVIAISEKNNLLNAPETYMEKISARVKEKNVIDLDYSIKKNISNLSDYLNKNPEDITACILDRPRHTKIIDELKQLKVNLKLISDGDICGALLVTESKYNIDLFLGIGGVMLLYLGANLGYLYQLDINSIKENKWVATEAIKVVLGASGGILISIAVSINAFTNISTQILCKSRTWHAMARDNLFFKSFGRLNSKYGTPNNALIGQGIWATVLLCCSIASAYFQTGLNSNNTYETIIDFFSATSTIFNLLTFGSIFVLRKKWPNKSRPYKALFYPWSMIIVISLYFSFLVITLITAFIPSIIGFILTLSGTFYYYYRAKN